MMQSRNSSRPLRSAISRVRFEITAGYSADILHSGERSSPMTKFAPYGTRPIGTANRSADRQTLPADRTAALGDWPIALGVHRLRRGDDHAAGVGDQA